MYANRSFFSRSGKYMYTIELGDIIFGNEWLLYRFNSLEINSHVADSHWLRRLSAPLLLDRSGNFSTAENYLRFEDIMVHLF